MLRGIASRALAGIVVVVAAAAGTLLFGGTPETAVVTIVGGSAGVLLALALGEPLHPAPPPPATGTDAAPGPLQAVIDAIVEPVLIVTERRVAMANRAALKLLGDHVVGEDVRTAIRHPAAAAHLGRLPGSSGEARAIDLAGLGRRDQRWQMHVADIPAGLLGTGVAGGARVVHLIDQTGNYQTERIRVDFVANASHELRTPLAAILGFIETLEDPEAGADAALRARFLKVMFDEARRMQRLVDDLMSLSRIEAEKHRAPDHAVDLGALAQEVATELRGGGDPRAENIEVMVAADLPPVPGDRGQLSQLLHNLVGNAMKYGRVDTPIAVGVARDGASTLLLTVADRGDGIAREHLPRLTERFYRVDSGRSRMLGGTGLGLAIVKHIVERHRGRLDIASRLGEGTTVSVRLPLPAGTDDAQPASG